MKRLPSIIGRSIRYSTFAPQPPTTQAIAPTKEPPKNDPFSQPTPDFKYSDLAANPFPDNVIKVLSNPIDPLDVEVKPDGILYVPEIKYRRLLMQAFGPGGWGLVPVGNHTVINKKTLSREYALFCHGRFVSQARGEQDFFSEEGIVTATEGVKSNALVRCCKDLGVFWELWDPRFIRKYKAEYVERVMGVHYKTGQSKWIYKKKGTELEFPYKLQK